MLWFTVLKKKVKTMSTNKVKPHIHGTDILNKFTVSKLFCVEHITILDWAVNHILEIHKSNIENIHNCGNRNVQKP